jgi:hypothetical protein
MNTTDLTPLQQQLAWALKAAQEAEERAARIQEKYDVAFAAYRQQFEDENPELVAQHAGAKELREKAQARAKQLREQASRMLTGEKYPKLPEGFKQTRERTPKWHPSALRDWCIRNMPFMLLVDEKAFNRFLLAVSDEDGYLPTWLMNAEMPADVVLTYKASISDKTLIQNAPQEAPVWTEEITGAAEKTTAETPENTGLLAAAQTLIEATAGQPVFISEAMAADLAEETAGDNPSKPVVIDDIEIPF